MSETQVQPTLDTAWWWKALAENELLVPTCRSCSHRFFPPQAFCNNCGSQDWHGAATSGLGKIYSWVVIHRAFGPDVADEVPYAIVAVDLDDGGRLIGRYFGALARLADALPVRVKIFHKHENALLGFEAID